MFRYKIGKNHLFCRILKMFLAIYVWILKMFGLRRYKNLHTQDLRMEILTLDTMTAYFTSIFADSLPTVTT